MNNKLALLPIIFTSLNFGMIRTAQENTKLAGVDASHNEAALLDYFREINTAEQAIKALKLSLTLPRGILNYVMWGSRYRPELITVYRQHGADPLQADCDGATNESYHKDARDQAARTWYSKYSIPNKFYGPQLPIQALAHHAEYHPILITSNPSYPVINEAAEKFELLTIDLTDEQKKLMFEHGKNIGTDVKSILRQPTPNDQRNSLLQRINAFYDRLAVEQSNK